MNIHLSMVLTATFVMIKMICFQQMDITYRFIFVDKYLKRHYRQKQTRAKRRISNYIAQKSRLHSTLHKAQSFEVCLKWCPHHRVVLSKLGLVLLTRTVATRAGIGTIRPRHRWPQLSLPILTLCGALIMPGIQDQYYGRWWRGFWRRHMKWNENFLGYLENKFEQTARF